jgi:hypothetical protein
VAAPGVLFRLLQTTPAFALRIAVGHRDIDGVDFAVPALKRVSGQVTMDGGRAAPSFIRLSYRNNIRTGDVGVWPAASGAFMVELPVGSRLTAQSDGSDYNPFSPILRLATLGGVSFLDKDSPAIRDDGPDEIRLEYALEGGLPMVAVQGRVTGEDIRVDGLRVELTSVAQFQSFVATVAPDGSFAFDRIPRGTYATAVTGGTDLTWSPPMTAFTGAASKLDVTVRQGRPADGSITYVTKAAPVATIRDAGTGIAADPDESAAAVADLRNKKTAQITKQSS